MVLLPCFNAEEFIEDQIKSILDQVGVDVQLQVSDDFSTDSTVEIVQQIASHDSRVMLAAQSKRIGAPGLHYYELMRRCHAEEFDFFAFADHDDIWCLDKLHRAAEFLTTTRSQLYSSAVTIFRNGKKGRVVRQATVTTEFDFLFEGAGHGCTYVMAPELFQAVREVCYDDPEGGSLLYYHDWLVYLVCRSRGFQWIYDKEPSVFYRIHAYNDTGTRLSANGLASRVKRLQSGWYGVEFRKALSLARKLGFLGADERSQMELPLAVPGGRRRRLALALLQLRAGRRRKVDRVVLFFFTLFGSIDA